jgi:hypothetical protein
MFQTEAVEKNDMHILYPILFFNKAERTSRYFSGYINLKTNFFFIAQAKVR